MILPPLYTLIKTRQKLYLNGITSSFIKEAIPTSI
jgi:hypothetical protein